MSGIALYIVPVAMLVISNMFMTYAWYGHLQGKPQPLLIAILASWAIAFFEYIFVVPANRIGSQVYTLAQLKTIQEVITLVVFTGFAVWWMGEKFTMNHVVGFALMGVGAWFIFDGPIGKVA
jgi:hypothetical protein